MLRAYTFGQCAFETSQARITPDSEIHFALLLSIATASAEGVARDELVARIWPRAEGDEGRHRLRQAMYRLRQCLVPVHLRGSYVLFDWEQTALDVHALLHETPRRETLVQLGALPFLPSYAPTLGEPYARWLEVLRARVATRLRRALAEEVTSTRSRGRFHEMGQVARALLALDPLNEVGTMGLAEALALEGSKVEALRLLEDYEEEVGTISADLQLPARVLRRRVAEVLDDSLVLRRFELPFVGREREFTTLRQLLREVRAGESRAAVITGEAGVGKSRLSGDFLRLAALDGATLACYTPSAGDSFTPISTLVTVGQLLLTLPGALGCAQEHLAYVRRIGTPETVTAWSVTGMSADILYAQLVQALAELVMAVGDEAPLVLFIDDAERLHPTTWRVLMDVWDRVGASSVCFLFAARRLPPGFGASGPRSCARLTQHIQLYPFSRDESLTFVERWSEKNQVELDDEAAQRVATTSQGNPFYLTELVAHLGHGGDPQQTPPSIRELIAAQHHALSKEAQRVLLVIALFEARATTTRVTQLLEMPAAEFMAALDELEGAGLVATTGPAVWCRHRLVGELASSFEVPSLVAFAHGRAAALLETEADATQSVELLGDCVRHWEAAGEMRKAYEAAMKLGYRLVGLGMGEEADKAFKRAEGLAEEKDQLLPAIEGQMTASQLAGRWSDVVALATRRSEGVRTRSRPAGRCDDFELLEAEASLFSTERVPDRDRLLDIVASSALSARLRLRAAVLVAIIADNFFDQALMRRALDASCSLVETGDDAPEAILLQTIFHTTIGSREVAQLAVTKLIDTATDSDDFSWRLLGLRRAAEASMRLGNTQLALDCAHDALELSRRLKLPVQEAACLEMLAGIAAARDDVGGARHFSEELDNVRVAENSAPAVTRRRLLTDARVAWITGDEVRASSVRATASSFPISPIPRAEQTLLTIRQSSTLITTPAAIDRVQLARLRELCRRGASFGGQDFAVSVVVQSLHSAGEQRAALHLSRRYLATQRLESFPAPTCFPGLGGPHESRGKRRRAY